MTCSNEDLQQTFIRLFSNITAICSSITARSRHWPTARIGRSAASRVQLQQRQNAVELQRRVRGFHPADLGFVLEGLEPEDRMRIWTALEPRQAAEALVEVDASVRAWLIGETTRHRLVKIAEALDPDDLAWIADDLPEDVMRQVRESLGEVDRTLLQQADAYPPTIGRTVDEPRGRDRSRDADDR